VAPDGTALIEDPKIFPVAEQTIRRANRAPYAFSRDGESLFVVGGAGYVLARVSLRTGAVLTRYASRVRSFRLSPDQRQIAFAAGLEWAGTVLRVTDVDGGSPAVDLLRNPSAYRWLDEDRILAGQALGSSSGVRLPDFQLGLYLLQIPARAQHTAPHAPGRP